VGTLRPNENVFISEISVLRMTGKIESRNQRYLVRRSRGKEERSCLSRAGLRSTGSLSVVDSRMHEQCEGDDDQYEPPNRDNNQGHMMYDV